MGGGERENFYSVYVISLNVSNCSTFGFKMLFLHSQPMDFKLTLNVFVKMILK